jgi:hypothetical protein
MTAPTQPSGGALNRAGGPWRRVLSDRLEGDRP